MLREEYISKLKSIVENRRKHSAEKLSDMLDSSLFAEYEIKTPDDEVLQKYEEFCEKNSVELLERHEDSSVFLSFKPDGMFDSFIHLVYEYQFSDVEKSVKKLIDEDFSTDNNFIAYLAANYVLEIFEEDYFNNYEGFTISEIVSVTNHVKDVLDEQIKLLDEIRQHFEVCQAKLNKTIVDNKQ